MKENNEIQKLLENCKKLEAELNERKRCIDFLLNKYKTNKRWFREELGKVTIEDIIKTSFDFGWTSRNNFECKNYGK